MRRGAATFIHDGYPTEANAISQAMKQGIQIPLGAQQKIEKGNLNGKCKGNWGYQHTPGSKKVSGEQKSEKWKEWKSEKELHEEIKAYKVDVNTILDQEHQFEFGYHDSSIEFLHGAILSISKLKESLINNDH